MAGLEFADKLFQIDVGVVVGKHHVGPRSKEVLLRQLGVALLLELLKPVRHLRPGRQTQQQTQ